MRWLNPLAICVLACLTATAGVTQGQGEAKAGVLIVVDQAGKETKLTSWRILSGTRRLGWLAPAAAPAELPVNQGKGKAVGGEGKQIGPEALEFREENSTTFVEGILTLVPLESIKRIDYDHEKNSVKLTYLKSGAQGAAEEGLLTGQTQFVGINKIRIEGEVDLGELGLAAVKFQGGDSKGVRSLQFEGPKPVPAVQGEQASITPRDKGKSLHEGFGLKVLYAAGGRELLLDQLMFKTTVKVDLKKLDRLRHVESGGKGESQDFEITLKDGAAHTLTLIRNLNPEDGKPATLQGLVGRVPAGYKLFPLHAIEEVQFSRK